jgi:hypothetical protein
MSECEKFFGLFRGTVMQNVDPERRGRLLVTVPDVLKVLPSTWAEPSVPLAGPTGPPSGIYAVPSIGTGVWVQFEHGDPNYPIWTGCRWGPPSDVPPVANLGNPLSPPLIIQSMGLNMVMISDSPVPPLLPAGGILLSTGTSYIRLDKTGITIFGAMVRVNGQTMVDINGGALTVTGPAPTGMSRSMLQMDGRCPG